MVKKDIVARVPANKEKGTKEMAATISVDYADNVKEAVQMFGEEALLSNAFANWRVTLQSNIRSSLKSGMDQAAIQSKLGSAKMGVAQVGAKVDAEQAFINKFKSATPEQQAKMLATLKKAAQA